MSCNATIQLETPGRLYSPGDTIRGTVRVALDKEIDVEEIVVKLKGHLSIRVRHGQGNRRRTYARSVELLRMPQRLFPPEELSRAGLKEYTMKKGEYEYPFEFLVPGHGDGPSVLPSLETWHGRICYSVKLTVRRASQWKGSVRCEEIVSILPCIDSRLLVNSPVSETTGAVSLVRKRALIKTGPKPKIEALLQAPRFGINHNHTGLGVALALRRDQLVTEPVRVKHIKVSLIRQERFAYAVDKGDSSHSKFKLFDQPFDYQVPFKEDVVDITQLLEQAKIPMDMTPSFSAGYIDIGYRIYITIEVEMGKASRGLDVSGQVVVQSPAVHEHNCEVSPPLQFQVPIH